MMICNWCGCVVDERKIDIDGNHKDFTGCIEALKRKVKALTQELIEERVITAQLTDRLEICRICPLADYEESKNQEDTL
jgi:transcription initiation factor TFIIIB Brf1 subunit/transcription initiation factor TFIIB